MPLRVEGDPRAAGRVATVIGVLFGLAGTGTSAVSVALPELADGLGVGTASAAWVIPGSSASSVSSFGMCHCTHCTVGFT